MSTLLLRDQTAGSGDTNQNQVIIPRLLQLARLTIGALDAAT